MAEDDSGLGKIDVKELKKLSPEARLKRLKELKAKRNTELEDAEKLIKESIVELERDEVIRKIPMPEQQVVNIEKLFEFADKERVKKASDKVKEEALKEAMESEMGQRGRTEGREQNPYSRLSVEDLNQQNPNLYRLSGQIYNTLKDFEKSGTDRLDDSDRQLLEAIVNKMPQFEINKSYNTADYVLDKMSASKRILKDMGYDTRFV